MNISNHTFTRYCERFLDMKDKMEIKQYIVQNKDRLTENILKLHEHSKHIYTGQIGDNTTKKFYNNKNVILVCNVKDDCVITLFKVDYGFPEKTNLIVIRDLLLEMDKKYKEQGKIKNKIKKELANKENELLSINEKIKLCEDQINILKSKKLSLTEEIKNVNYESNIIQKDIDKIALQLCNSVEYRKDLLNSTL